MNAPLMIVLVILIAVVGKAIIKIIRPHEKGLVERWGKYHRLLNPGLNVVAPIMDRTWTMDMREQVIDVPEQQVITKDNAAVMVDAIIYIKISDPFRAKYNVESFKFAALKLAQTNLRNEIGNLELDQTLTSREQINTRLRQILDDATDVWGLKVTRVEIQRIEPPRDITDSMSRQMKAEREKRAAILDAEGVKQAAITTAEGERQRAILEAEGKAQAIKSIADADKYQKIALAQGEAQAIETVFSAIHSGKPTNDLLAIKYLEALSKIADGNATKIFLPLEATGVLGSIAGIGELFKETKASSEKAEKK